MLGSICGFTTFNTLFLRFCETCFQDKSISHKAYLKYHLKTVQELKVHQFGETRVQIRHERVEYPGKIKQRKRKIQERKALNQISSVLVQSVSLKMDRDRNLQEIDRN
jgi:hypothetical protein